MTVALRCASKFRIQFYFLELISFSLLGRKARACIWSYTARGLELPPGTSRLKFTNRADRKVHRGWFWYSGAPGIEPYSCELLLFWVTKGQHCRQHDQSSDLDCGCFLEQSRRQLKRIEHLLGNINRTCSPFGVGRRSNSLCRVGSPMISPRYFLHTGRLAQKAALRPSYDDPRTPDFLGDWTCSHHKRC